MLVENAPVNFRKLSANGVCEDEVTKAFGLMVRSFTTKSRWHPTATYSILGLRSYQSRDSAGDHRRYGRRCWAGRQFPARMKTGFNYAMLVVWQPK
jgi:hypothetical protein